MIIGSRESRLAVIQSEMVRDYILSYNKDCEVELLTMKTTGDKILDRTLDKVGGKGLFVKELDKAIVRKKESAFGTQFKGYADGSTGGTSAFSIFQTRRPKRCTGTSGRYQRTG